MRQVVMELSEPRLRWIDVVNPTPAELEELAAEHDLPPHAVQDCLEPEHLPKHERLGQRVFMIVRAYDERAAHSADTVQQLTRKVALFVSNDLLLTVHRVEQRFLDDLKRELPARLAGRPDPGERVVAALLDAVLDTYWPPLDEAERAVAHFEHRLFERRDVTQLIREVYLLKRKVTALRWMGRHTLDLIQKLKASSEAHAPRLLDLKENAEGLYFAADELLEDVNNLVNLQLSLAAHQTNEVMRVLTVFSVFFMPLTFVVGIYGMNFDLMPELKQPWGYPGVLGLMALLSAGIYAWFKRRGWL